MGENNTDSISREKSQSRLHLWRVFVPVIIGLVVVVWLFHSEFNVAVWQSVHFDTHVILCIALAWVFMAGRDFGLTWRFRALSDRDLTWWQALRVNFMCEFTSAITPSAVGGSSLGMVFMHQEGINLGRATTLMLTTLFLDELFFVVACPIIVAIIPYNELFGFDSSAFSIGLKWVFWGVYVLLFIWTAILFMGILVKPIGMKKLLMIIFKFKPLRRW